MSAPLCLIHLVSEQTMPNVLAALASTPAAQHLIHTPRTEPHARWIKRALTRAGLTPVTETTTLSDAPDLRETGTAVRAVIDSANAAGLTPVINFTGGTKLMSIGAFAAAHAARAASLYFDTEHHTIHSGPTGVLPSPFDQPAVALRAARDRLTIDVIAAAHGVQRVTPGRDPAPWIPAATLLVQDPKLEMQTHDFARGLDEGQRRATDYMRLLDRPLNDLPDSLIEPFSLASLIALRDDRWHFAFDRRTDLEGWAISCGIPASLGDYFAAIAPLQQFIAFLTGAWWEVAVADAATRSGRFRDLRWSVEIERQPGSPSFEEDLMGIDGLNLAVFSCKRGGDRPRLLRAFDELESGARSLGGAMVRRFLCVAMPIAGYQIAEVRARAAASRTTLLGPASRLNQGSFADPIA